MKKYTNEFKVGLFFIICVLGLVYLTIGTGKVQWGSQGYYIYAVFDNIQGLEKNAPVMLNGLEVGRVRDINIYYDKDRTQISLKLLIRQDVKIRNNPVIAIKTLGLMGEKYVEITDTEGEGFVKPGQVIVGKNPADLDALFIEAQKLSRSITSLADETKNLVVNVNGLLKDNRNNLTSTLSNIKNISEKVKLTFEDNQDSIYRVIKNLEATSKNFEEFSKDIKRHPWKLLFRTKEKKKEEKKDKSPTSNIEIKRR